MVTNHAIKAEKLYAFIILSKNIGIPDGHKCDDDGTSKHGFTEMKDVTTLACISVLFT